MQPSFIMGMDDGIERLKDGGYLDWAWQMRAWLIRKDFWEVVSGEETVPVGGPQHKVVRAFRKKQQQACAEIILHVDSSQKAHTRFNDPKEIWDNLAKVHLSRGLASRLSLLRQLFTMVKDPDGTMASWIADVKNVSYKLIDDKHPNPLDEEIIIAILTNGLPDSYDSLRVNLDSTPDAQLTLDYVVARLLNEETRQVTSVPFEQKFAMAATHGQASSSRFRNVTCYACGLKGHYANDPICKGKQGANQEGESGAAATAEFAGGAHAPLLT